MSTEGSTMTPAAWAGTIARLDVQNRARVLGKLLGFVGPLALAVLGNGAFAKYVFSARKPFVPVSSEDARARDSEPDPRALALPAAESSGGVSRRMIR